MNIKQIYQRIRKQAFFSMLLPLSFSLLFIVIFGLYDFGQILSPQHFDELSQISANDLSTPSCIVLKKAKLHYTGYDFVQNGAIKGHYYYSIQNHVCYLVLLRDQKSETVPNVVSPQNIRLLLTPLDKEDEELLTELSNDIDYSKVHLSEDTAPFVAIQSDALYIYSIIACMFSLICILITTYITLSYALVILFPTRQKSLFPKCHKDLREQMLSQLSMELGRDTLNFQWSSNPKRDFFFTDSFLINFSSRRTRILPVNEILWVYKHTPKTVHKQWDTPARFSIHLVLKNRQHIVLHGFEETNADTLIALLYNKDKDILIGYSSEHLLLAKEFLHSMETMKR